MSHPRHRLRLLGALALLTALGPAAAAMPPATRRAVSHFNRGLDLARHGRYRQAIALWRQAVPALPPSYRSTARLDIGQAYQRLGELPEAWYYTHLYVGASPRDARTHAALVRLESVLARTRRRVHITVRPAAASVRLDAAPHAYPTPLDWWLAPGVHVLRVKADRRGYQAREAHVAVTPGRGVQQITLTLAPAPPAPKPPLNPAASHVTKPAALHVTKSAALHVTKPAALHVTKSAASHVTKPAALHVTKPAASAPAVPDVALDVHVGPSESTAPWAWSLVGVGAAALATGVGLNLWAIDQAARSWRYAATPAGLDDKTRRPLVDRASSHAKAGSTAAYILYGVGVGAVVTGVVLLLTEHGDDSAHTEDPPSTPRAGLVPLPGGAALTMTGAF